MLRHSVTGERGKVGRVFAEMETLESRKSLRRESNNSTLGVGNGFLSEIYRPV